MRTWGPTCLKWVTMSHISLLVTRLFFMLLLILMNRFALKWRNMLDDSLASLFNDLFFIENKINSPAFNFDNSLCTETTIIHLLLFKKISFWLKLWKFPLIWEIYLRIRSAKTNRKKKNSSIKFSLGIYHLGWNGQSTSSLSIKGTNSFN